MNANEFGVLVITALVSAVVGGGGFTGIVFFYIKHYLEKRLNSKEEHESRKRDYLRRRKTVMDEKEHAEGRLLFWIHKAIVDGEHNGDLEQAWELFKRAEEKEKELDREIIVDCEN